MAAIRLREADRAEISILVDNTSDLLLSDTECAKRLKLQPPAAPLAEHGLSCLVSVWAGSEKHTILMDAGVSGSCMLHNASLLESSPYSKDESLAHRIEDVESVVLSHGHFDHFQGLAAFFQRTGRKMPLILHPDAFSERRARPNTQQIRPLPSLQKESLEAAGALMDERNRPSTLAEDLILVTGQVERKTDFERGSPGLEARVGDAWIPDPFHDDQGIAIHLRGKGLIVLSGCSHAGIINTVYHTRNATGIERVHAVMGGFHLGGKSESLIEPTIDEMVGINPDIIVPMHCTGWKAIQRFAEVMPDAFIFNCVGTTYLFSN